MKRNERSFIEKIGAYCEGRDVLEVGCGDGTRLSEAVRKSRSWLGIDPDAEAIRQSRTAGTFPNATFMEGTAADIDWPKGTFDVVIFTLSLHHMEYDVMPTAVDEAVRVVRPDGRLIFLEPLPEGTFYEAEMRFGCCDGDERKELAYAMFVMLNSDRLYEVEEFTDRVSVEYESFDDFLQHVPSPEEARPELERYLAGVEFKLDERFRMNVFEVAS